MAMACVFDNQTDTVSHTYIGNSASYRSINTSLLPLVFFSLISTKLRPNSPLISCVNSPEFLSSDWSELPFRISTSTLPLLWNRTPWQGKVQLLKSWSQVLHPWSRNLCVGLSSFNIISSSHVLNNYKNYWPVTKLITKTTYFLTGFITNYLVTML